MSFEHMYKEVCKWYALTPPLVGVCTFFFDAPFGRFALSGDNRLQFDGIKSWILMELFAPLSFLFAFLRAPLASADSISARGPRTLLALLFLTHYMNRALLSPLRSPPRSKAHVSVPLSGITFNLINGTLMGAYLASPACAAFLLGRSWGSTRFWAGIALWAAGLAGNVLHDEVLMDIRRDAQNKKDDAGKEGSEAKPHYGIPRGYLYRYVSYPNYLCEWAEWAGFALAAAPLPSLSLSPLSSAAPAGLAGLLAGAAPPWLFFASEIFLMAPRAYRGHKWYRARFPDYPTERRAVIPFVF